MKMFLRSLLLSSVLIFLCLLAPSASSAFLSFSIFEKDMSYRIQQKKWRGDLTQLTFDYQLILKEEDQFRLDGVVFVGFRQRSIPDDLWLLDRNGVWTKYDASKDPVMYTGEMNPVIPIYFFPQPTDVSAYSGDGELWVGYGFFDPDEDDSLTLSAAFQDMMDNARYEMVWRIGEPRQVSTIILLNATDMAVSTGEVYATE